MSPYNDVSPSNNTCSPTLDWKLLATQHPDFWFSDGSIVLCVDKMLFRVHQTILGKHSEVFEDLFTLPQPIKEEEMVEGCRVVMMHDSKEEFGDLLNAIYDPSYARVVLIYVLSNIHFCADISTTYHLISTSARYSILSVVSSNSAQNISSVRSGNDASPSWHQNSQPHLSITSPNRLGTHQKNMIRTRSCVRPFLLRKIMFLRSSHMPITVSHGWVLVGSFSSALMTSRGKTKLYVLLDGKDWGWQRWLSLILSSSFSNALQCVSLTCVPMPEVPTLSGTLLMPPSLRILYENTQRGAGSMCAIYVWLIVKFSTREVGKRFGNDYRRCLNWGHGSSWKNNREWVMEARN